MNTDNYINFDKKQNNIKTILLMAGVHPEEESGVYCLSELIENPLWLQKNRDYNLIIVPCRNKMGFYIKQNFNNEGHIKGDLLYKSEFVSIYKLESRYFVLPTIHAMKLERGEFWKNMKKELKSINISGYVNIFGYKKNTEIRTNTYYFDGSNLFDLNDFENYSSPENYSSEIVNIPHLFQEYKPNLVIDIHEGKGNDFYVYVNEHAFAMGKHVVGEMKKLELSIRENSNDRKKMDSGIYNMQALKCWDSWKKYMDNEDAIMIEIGSEINFHLRVKYLQYAIDHCISFVRNGVRDV